MIFTSLEYLLFLPIVSAAYFLLPHRFRPGLLLAASYYFYMRWRPEYALLMLFSTLVCWWSAIRMAGASSTAGRRLWLATALVVNLGLLFFFKYWVFANTVIQQVLHLFGRSHHYPIFDLLLPLGISFYIFQLLGYVFDVYMGHYSAEKKFGTVALYVSFFPQMVAGPIERSANLIPQFFEKHAPSLELISSGLRLILWGFFKKLVIADRLAAVVNDVYAHPSEFGAVSLLMATYAFAFQIYCDFSGYSDIAIGSARLMGFRLMMNFDHPYGSASLKEFWTRWHISLSSWFRDYVYHPLGGSRVSSGRRSFNLIVVFALSGLWHGANPTYAAWGLYHGGAMIVELAVQRVRNLIPAHFPSLLRIWGRWAAVFVTFHVVAGGWILFRARTMADAAYIQTSIIGAVMGGIQNPALIMQALRANPLRQFPIGTAELAASAVFVSVLVIAEQRLRSSGQSLVRLVPVEWVRLVIYFAVLAMILLFGIDHSQQFIYFQF